MIATINSAIARKRGEGEKGFTLIELLVVILIIGVLAAIAIPAFLGQQDQAKEAAVKSDLATSKIAMASFLVESSAGPAVGTPAGTDLATLKKFGWVTGVVVDTSGAAYCLELTRETFTGHVSADGVPTTGSLCP